MEPAFMSSYKRKNMQRGKPPEKSGGFSIKQCIAKKRKGSGVVEHLSKRGGTNWEDSFAALKTF